MNIPLVATLDTESKRIIRMNKFRADLEASGVLKDLNGSFLNDIQDKATDSYIHTTAHNTVATAYKEHIVEPFHPELISERIDTQLNTGQQVDIDSAEVTQGNEGKG